MLLKVALRRMPHGLLLSALLPAVLCAAAPALAQSANPDGEARLRKLEAEVRALQRQVFPGSDGKFFTPQVTPGAGPAATPAVPATTPVTDLLTRMDAVEAQIARLTAQSEETANRVAQLEARLAGSTALSPAPAAAAPAPAPAPAPAAASVPAASAPAAAAASTPTPPAASPPVLAAAAPKLVGPPPPDPDPVEALAKPGVLTTPAPLPAPKPAAVAKPAPKPAAIPLPAKPTAQRVAAVEKVEKPDTGNPAEDDYSYGFRLWEAKFFPEAQQQLRLYVDKYPKDAKISYGRNLLGRAYLDDGKPRDAAPWFLKNYQTDKKGPRASESLLYLAESMRQLNDTGRACIALAEFADTYPAETGGRLKGLYDSIRKGVKCD